MYRLIRNVNGNNSHVGFMSRRVRFDGDQVVVADDLPAADAIGIYRIERNSAGGHEEVWLFDMPATPNVPDDDRRVAQWLNRLTNSALLGRDVAKVKVRRRPVALICAATHAMHVLVAPRLLNMTVYNNLDSKSPAAIPCVWCGNHDLDVIDAVCPSCDNPIHRVPFVKLNANEVFCCSSGGKWRRSACPGQAVCIEDDSAFRIGEEMKFDNEEIVFAYK